MNGWLRSGWAVGFACAAVAGLAGVYLLAYGRPVAFASFVQEDHLAENATFAFWLVAATILAVRVRSDPRYRKPGFALLGAAAFVVAMDEISWGQRLLSLKTPAYFQEHNLQGELTWHNFVVLPYYYPLAGLTIVAWALCLPWLTRRHPTLESLCRRTGVFAMPPFLLPVFLATAWLSLPNRWIALPERDEAFELFLSFSVLLLALFIDGTRSRRKLLGAVAASLLVSLTLFAVHPPGAMSAGHANFLAGYRFVEVGLFEQSRELFEYILARPELRAPESEMDYGRVLMRLGRVEAGRKRLENAFAAEARLPPNEQRSAAAARRRGVLLLALGRSEEAAAAFDFAVREDRRALERATAAAERHRLRLSLVRTEIARGDFEAAQREYAEARAEAPRRLRLRGDILYDFERRRALALRP